MTLLIKNVLLAEKEQPERVDILVRGQKISAIGNFPTRKAHRVLDGQGAWISSGFIDAHSTADHTLDLLKKPKQTNNLLQGIATLVGGKGGLSLAPIPHGELSALQEWTHRRGFNLDWRSMDEFLRVFRRLKLGVNFGSLVGYSTLREAIVGPKERAITKNESAVLENLFRKSMKEGALGMSFGFNSIHGRPVSIAEIRSIVRRIRKNTVQTFELDPDNDRIAKLEELIDLAGQTGARFIISGLDPLRDNPQEYEKILSLLDSTPADLDLHFCVSPQKHQTLPLYQFLPVWAKKGSLEEMQKSLRDNWYRQKISGELIVRNPDKFIILNAVDPALDGMTLREFSAHFGIRTFKKALLKLMELTRLQASILEETNTEHLLKKVIKHPRCLIGTHAANFDSHIPEMSFKNYLKDLQEETLAADIKRITAKPAELFGLTGRGSVREGNFADLVIFRKDEIRHVVVNGSIAVENGVETGARDGLPLFTHG